MVAQNCRSGDWWKQGPQDLSPVFPYTFLKLSNDHMPYLLKSPSGSLLSTEQSNFTHSALKVEPSGSDLKLFLQEIIVCFICTPYSRKRFLIQLLAYLPAFAYFTIYSVWPFKNVSKIMSLLCLKSSE